MASTGSGWRNFTSAQAGDVPLGRSSHSMVTAHEGGKEVVVLFGGEQEPRHPIDNAVHVLDVASHRWTRIVSLDDNANSAPVARVGHAAASVGHRVFVFGGRTGVDQVESTLGDMWEFDVRTSRWHKIEVDGIPSARSYHSMASHGHKIYMFGGCGSDGRLNDLFVFDAKEEKWEELKSSSGKNPGIRGGPALYATADKVYVFGGFCGNEMGDFWAYDLHAKKWEPVEAKGDVPLPRSVTAFATLDDKHLFLFGGEIDPSTQGHAGAGDYTNETYVYDVTTNTWHKQATGGDTPTPRGWLAGTSLPGGRLVHFGGFDGKERVPELHIFTLGA